MTVSRTTVSGQLLQDAALTRDMASIGMNFAVDASAEAKIEETLVSASELGMEQHDLRVLAVMTTWLGVHHRHINADRLVDRVSAHTSVRVHAYWAAIATWLGEDHRFTPLAAYYGGPALDLLAVGTDFQLARRGEDPRFAGSVLRVPVGTLRDREADVLSPEALIRRHAGYRNRVLMGPTWRADLWTVLERDPDVSVAEAAHRAGCSFATALPVVQDFRLLRTAQPSVPYIA